MHIISVIVHVAIHPHAHSLAYMYTNTCAFTRMCAHKLTHTPNPTKMTVFSKTFGVFIVLIFLQVRILFLPILEAW